METEQKMEADLDDLVTLCVDGQKFSSDRRLLCQKSLYFRGMFDSQMKESQASTIELKETDAVAMEIIIDYVKTSNIKINDDNVHKVAEVSCMFQVQEVTNLCCQHLTNSLNTNNCLSTMIFADFHNLSTVYNKSRHWVLWYFDEVIKTEEFLELSKTSLLDIICDEQLKVRSELWVMDAISSWVQHEREVRQSDFIEILFNSQFHEFLSKSDIIQIKNHPLIRDDASCCERLKNLLSGTEQAERRRARPHALLALGMVKNMESAPDSDKSRFLQKWDENTQKFLEEDEFPLSLPVSGNADTGLRMCVNGERLFVSGGEATLGKNQWYWDVWCYNAFDRKWTTPTRLRQPRRHHAMCALGEDSILLLGGLGRYRVKLDKVEQYNFSQDSWTTLAPMPLADFSQAVCELQSKIYIFKSQSYCYNPADNTWRDLPNIPGYLQFTPFSAVVMGNNIYLTANDNTRLMSFDVDSGLYTRVGEFSHCSVCSNPVLYNNCIYQIRFEEKTGDNSENYPIDSKDGVCVLEQYDLKINAVNLSRVKDISLFKSILLVVPAFIDFRH